MGPEHIFFFSVLAFHFSKSFTHIPVVILFICCYVVRLCSVSVCGQDQTHTIVTKYSKAIQMLCGPTFSIDTELN